MTKQGGKEERKMAIFGGAVLLGARRVVQLELRWLGIICNCVVCLSVAALFACLGRSQVVQLAAHNRSRVSEK